MLVRFVTKLVRTKTWAVAVVSFTAKSMVSLRLSKSTPPPRAVPSTLLTSTDVAALTGSDRRTVTIWKPFDSDRSAGSIEKAGRPSSSRSEAEPWPARSSGR